MNDNQVIIQLIGAIEAGLTLFNIENVEVLQGYQPTQQGIPEGDAIFIHKIPSRHYGHPKEKNVYNQETGQFDQTREFIRLSKWQINARAQQRPDDIMGLTASDLVEAVADILNMQESRDSLSASGIGIERIAEIRIAYDGNEKERFEQEPSCDIVLNHKKTYTSTVRRIERGELNINRV